MYRPVLALTIGDPNGIGPEVVLKSLTGADPAFEPVLVGAVDVWKHHAAVLGLEHLEFASVTSPRGSGGSAVSVLEPASVPAYEVTSGVVSARAGTVAMAAVELAVDRCLSGEVDGMVTAPISKEAVRRAGYDIPGHTEYIADRTTAGSFAMMMVADELRVALVTTHCPLRSVAEKITPEAIREKLDVLEQALRGDLGVDRPSIAVLGLNPHAGDGGMIGREELETVEPAIRAFTSSGCSVSGPFSADAFFGRARYTDHDAVLAMYHDQGLIPFKTLHSDEGINYTAGLPIVRTSPDHGTAFDIAGKGIARPNSMMRAIALATDVARRRKASGAAS